MSGNKSDAFAAALISEIFGTTHVMTGLVPHDTLYLSLHTADPAGGDQTSNEAAYDDYARFAAIRGGGTEWTVTDNQAVNTNDDEFPQCNASFDPSTETITHVGIGAESSGAGLLLYSKALAVPLVVGALVTPKILAEQITVTET